MIAKCKCGSESAHELGPDSKVRRYCENKKCLAVGPWRLSGVSADAAWNDLIGEPSVTWTTETAEAIGGSWFVSVTDAAGYTVGGAGQKLDAKNFGALADSFESGRYTLTITCKRVEAEPPAEPAEPKTTDVSMEERVVALIEEAQHQRTMMRKLTADMESHRTHVTAHNLTALYERINKLANRLSDLFAIVGAHQTATGADCHEPPPEPTPDVQPDCRTVPIKYVNGDVCGEHRIERNYYPGAFELDSRMYVYDVVAADGSYRAINPVVATSGQPLRPEASDV